MAKTPKKPKRPISPPMPVDSQVRVPKQRLDLNQLAARIVAESVGETEKTPDPDTTKDPAAVKRGRKGGAKGGKARAAKLDAATRTKIAKKAAKARWNPQP